MPKFHVSWTERRSHYINVEAEDEFHAIELARDLDYSQTASDSSIFEDFAAVRTNLDEPTTQSLNDGAARLKDPTIRPINVSGE